MPFAYKRATISGNVAGTEGTSKLIQEIKDVAVNQMGWTLYDDRTDQRSTNHKLVLSSNGEDGTYPTFYMVITSGNTTGTAAQNTVLFQVATAWDTTIHRVPASGIVVPVASGVQILATSTNTQYTAWISGDKDAIHVITKVSTTYDSTAVGHVKPFYSPALHPYPLFVNGDATTTTVITDAVTTRLIAGNPPRAFTTGSDAQFMGMAVFTNANQPYIAAVNPAITSIYMAMPLLVGPNTVAEGKDFLGIAPGIWQGAGSNAGMLNEAILTMSGTDGVVQQYIAFLISTTASLIVRRS